jgi:competence/damage-inducible protein CinA-like protein
MSPTVEIFSQGEEVITGQVADTNAAWLSQQLMEMGFLITRHTAVGDKLTDLTVLLKEIANRAECCICTGGLGPTCDDLTAKAVAQAFDLPLQFDEIAFAAISGFFQHRGMDMPEVNRKQAMFPQGATRIDNDVGTAPGFCLRYQNCWFVFLPGVPYEMQKLFSQHIKSLLKQRFSLTPPRLVTIKTWGLGESQLQAYLNQISLPDSVQLGFRAGWDENQTKLLFPFDYPLDATEKIIAQIVEKMGAAVFAVDGLSETAGDLISVVAHLLTAQQKTVAVLETASCGLVAARCVGQAWLVESVYQQKYTFSDNESATELINTAKQLGLALQQTSGADFALIQLYAGNKTAFSDPKQSVTLYNILTAADGFCHHSKTLAGSMQRKQHNAAFSSLDLLRRFLQQTHSLCPYYA